MFNARVQIGARFQVAFEINYFASFARLMILYVAHYVLIRNE